MSTSEVKTRLEAMRATFPAVPQNTSEPWDYQFSTLLLLFNEMVIELYLTYRTFSIHSDRLCEPCPVRNSRENHKSDCCPGWTRKVPQMIVSVPSSSREYNKSKAAQINAITREPALNNAETKSDITVKFDGRKKGQ